MPVVSEEERIKQELENYTFTMDNDLDPKVVRITIPIGRIAADVYSKSANPITMLGAVFLDFSIQLLKICNVINSKRAKTGIIQPAKMPNGKLRVH